MLLDIPLMARKLLIRKALEVEIGDLKLHRNILEVEKFGGFEGFVFFMRGQVEAQNQALGKEINSLAHFTE